MKQIRVVLADDHESIRRSVSTLLRMRPKLVIVCEASDGKQALKCIDEHDPDLLILDIRMPELNGWEVTKHLYRHRARVKIIVFSGNVEPAAIPAEVRPMIAAIVEKSRVESLLVALDRLIEEFESHLDA